MPDITLQEIDHKSLSPSQVSNRLIYLHQKRQLALQQYKQNDTCCVAAAASFVGGVLTATFKGNALDISFGLPAGQSGCLMLVAGAALAVGFLIGQVFVDEKRRKTCPYDAKTYDYWMYDTAMAHPKLAGKPNLGNTYLYPQTAATWHSRHKNKQPTAQLVAN